MSLSRLAFKNIFRSPFRSLAVFGSAALVAAAVFAMVMVLRGAEAGLRASLSRLGADFIIIPFGGLTSREDMKTFRIMTPAITNWMPKETLEKIAAVQGVASVSPQLYMFTEEGGEYAERVNLVAFDPDSDFTINPWLTTPWEGKLALGEVIAGSALQIPASGEILLHGYPLKVVTHLERTENLADFTLFISYETAQDLIQRTGYDLGYAPRFIPTRASAVMVRVDNRSRVRDVYLRMLEEVERVRPLSSTDLFQTEREQLVGLLRSALSFLGLIILLSVAFVFLVYTIAVNERSREIGVLRALGFPRLSVVLTLVYEGALLAGFGGLAGSVLSGAGFYFLRNYFAQSMNLIIEPPSAPLLAALILGGVALAMLSVALATLFPSYRITYQETAAVVQE